MDLNSSELWICWWCLLVSATLRKDDIDIGYRYIDIDIDYRYRYRYRCVCVSYDSEGWTWRQNGVCSICILIQFLLKPSFIEKQPLKTRISMSIFEQLSVYHTHSFLASDWISLPAFSGTDRVLEEDSLALLTSLESFNSQSVTISSW